MNAITGLYPEAFLRMQAIETQRLLATGGVKRAPAASPPVRLVRRLGRQMRVGQPA